MTAQTQSGGEEGNNASQYASIDEIVNGISSLPNSPEFTSLKSSLNQVASEYYHSNKNGTSGKLALDEARAKELSQKLWNAAADHVAKHYLKLSDEQVASFKGTKDPDSGKNQFVAMMTSILGIDEEALYSTLKTRGSVDPEQIDTLANPIYNQHLQTAISKRVSKDITDNKKADAALHYLTQLKGALPKALAPLSVPTAYRSIEEVQRLIATAASAVPQDYPVSLASKYAQAHKH